MHKGKVRRKRFGADLPGALTFLLKMSKVRSLAGAPVKSLTLRCCNMGFAPPAKLQPHDRTVKVKGKKRPQTVRVVPMRSLNRKRGIWWCPYCMKLRVFVHQKTARVEGVTIKVDRQCCPMCQVSDKDSHVRKWNPLAYEIEAHDD